MSDGIAYGRGVVDTEREEHSVNAVPRELVPPARPMREAPRHALVFGLFVLLSVLHTWPIARELDRLYFHHADVFVNMWALNDLARQMVRDPWHLFDGSIFYPYDKTLATVDHLVANAAMIAPLREATEEPLLVYNVAYLATFALSGFFTYLLVLRLSGSVLGGIVAGCAFAFCAYRFTHFIHLHLLSTQWIPLAFLALHRYMERPDRRGWLAVTAGGLLVAVSSWHIALIGAVALAAGAAALFAARPDGRARRLAGLAVAAAIVALIVSPIALTYAEVFGRWQPAAMEGQARTNDRARHSVTIEGLVLPPEGSRAPYMPLLDRELFGESRMFPGVIGLAIAAPAVVLLRRRREERTRSDRALQMLLVGSMALVAIGIAGAAFEWTRLVGIVRASSAVAVASAVLVAICLRAATRAGAPQDLRAVVACYAIVAVVGASFAFGPRVMAWEHDLGPGLYLYDRLPGLGIIRAPARFSLLFGFSLAVLGGIGLARLERRMTAPRALLVGILLLTALNVEVRNAPFDAQRSPSRRAVHRWLAENREPGAVVEYPTQQNQWAIIASLDYDRRIVNGASYVWPPEMQLAERDALSPRHLSLLWEYFHPRFVVLRSLLYPPEEREQVMERVRSQGAALRLRTESAGDYVFQLIDRGAGPVVPRRWPRAALEEAQGFEFAAVVAGARDDAVPRLMVTFNGHPALAVEGTDAGRPDVRFVPIDNGRLVDGQNTLELGADYRFRADAPGHAVGSTGGQLRADVYAASLPDRAFVQVNGRTMAADKGYLLVALDAATGAVESVGHFNTSWRESDADALAAFVRGLPDGTPVVVTSEYDVSRALNDAAVAALRTLGLSVDLRGKFGWQHAAIGWKGAAVGSGLEASGARDASITLGAPHHPMVQLSMLRVY